jgi:hypothetical protein
MFFSNITTHSISKKAVMEIERKVLEKRIYSSLFLDEKLILVLPSRVLSDNL